METGDRRTEDRGGASRKGENVIRLPREWLGPPEELVPIGPAARARAERAAADAMPPTADAFWSEDSAALHDAVQAPSGAAELHLDPPFGLVPPVIGRRRLRRAWLGRPDWVRRAGRLRWAWPLLATVVAGLIVVGVIAARSRPSTTRTAVHTPALGAITHASADAAPGVDRGSIAAARAKTQVEAQRRAHATAVRHVRARTHARARRTDTPPHRATPTHRAEHPAVQTVTHAAASSSTSDYHTPTSTATTPSSSTASAGSSSGSKPAPPPAGPTSLGSMSGGCTVKCS